MNTEIEVLRDAVTMLRQERDQLDSTVKKLLEEREAFRRVIKELRKDYADLDTALAEERSWK